MNYLELDACISKCGNYRYHLTRVWDYRKKYLLVIGLNPSTADATRDDPTIRRCVNLAVRLGFGSLYMMNLFAWRETKPKLMKAVAKPVGPRNDFWLQAMSDNPECGMILAAWGNDGNHLGRAKEVIQKLPPLRALKINANGTPAHPLYFAHLTPKPYAQR